MPDEESYESSVPMSRAEYVYNLTLRGVPASEIAAELGVDLTHVYAIIEHAFRAEASAISPENKQGLIALEVGRLNKIQRASWDAMEMGDSKAADIILKCIALRMKIQKLDLPDAAINQNTVLVIAGQTQDYIERLKELT